jgi:hypothetical protein
LTAVFLTFQYLIPSQCTTHGTKGFIVICIRIVHTEYRVVSLTAIAWVHSSAWIEWLPAEQLVEGSNPSGPALISLLYMGSEINKRC